MTITYILASIALYGLSIHCELAERKSRKWYADRNLLRLSGFFFALGTVALACAIAL